MNETMDNIENTMEDVGNVVEDTTNSMVTGVKNGATGVANAIGDMGATVMDTMDMNSDNYTSTRTATTSYTNEGTFLGLNSMAWTWLIIGFIGIAIVGLVIYYNMQKDYTRGHSRDRDNF